MSAARTAATRFVIQGREVRLPVVVRDASSGAATYAVSTAAARRLIPGDVLEPVEIWPGRALCSLAVIDYRDNDLGDYNEVSIAFFVRERAAARGLPYVGTIADFLRGRVATYIRHLPVDQRFTCEAGRTIWGFQNRSAHRLLDRQRPRELHPVHGRPARADVLGAARRQSPPARCGDDDLLRHRRRSA
jgi:hypothetical protein